MLRKARIEDAAKIVELIDHYAKQGLMLPRTLASVYRQIRDYTVLEIEGEVKGVGCLQIFWKDLAEIRSLSVHPDFTGKGFGKALVNKLFEEAISLGITKVFSLTYQPGFFQKCGFVQVNKKELPQKVWTECINCPKFPACDEIAMVRCL